MKYVLILISLLLSNSALACSCKESSIGSKYHSATDVFIGHITKASELLVTSDGNHPNGQTLVRAEYELVESFKGKETSSGLVFDRPFSQGSCSVLMTPGVKYIFFNYGSERISVCGGSRYYNANSDKELLETLRNLRNENDL